MKNMVVIVVVILLGAAGYYFKDELQIKLDEFTTHKQGQDALHRNDWTEALVVYEAAHDKYPNNAGFSFELAKILHRELRKYGSKGGIVYTRQDLTPPVKKQLSTDELQQQAEALYRQSILIDNNNLDARIGLGELLKETPNRYMEAVGIYREALVTFPNNPKLLKALGDLYKLAGDKRDPEDFSRKNVSLRNWLYNWAIYYYRLSLKADPSQYVPYFNLGVLYHLLEEADTTTRQNNLRDASRAYCNAKLIDSTKFELYYNLGLVLIDLGVVEEGFRQLSQAVDRLVAQDRVLDAQQLATQIQAIRNMVQTRDAAQFLTPADVDNFLTTCTQPAPTTTP